MITILEKSNNYIIPYSVLNDSGLSNLFSEHILEIISCPCSGAVIKKRHEIFESLQDQNFYDRFNAAYLAMADYCKCLAFFKDEMPFIQKLFVISAVAKKYFYALKELSLIPENGEYMTNLHYQVETLIDNSTSASEAYAKVCEYINAHNNCTIRFANGSIVLARITEAEKKKRPFGLFESAAKILQKFGNSSNYSQISLPIGLSPQIAEMIRVDEQEKFNLEAYIVLLSDCITKEILLLKNEFGFYLQMYSFVNKMTDRKIPVCLPSIAESKEISMRNAHNYEVSSNFAANSIGNDVVAGENDSIVIICGANGGGKTTYLNTILQNMILFLAGCPVLCEKARIYPYSELHSYFVDDEKCNKSRFEYEQERIKHIIIDSGENESILFLNEPYSSTNEINAIEQMNHLFNLARKRGLTVFVVTHFEIEKGQSYLVMSPIVDQNGKRTYKFERRLSAGASMCADILKRYKCDYESLMQIVESKKW